MICTVTTTKTEAHDGSISYKIFGAPVDEKRFEMFHRVATSHLGKTTMWERDAWHRWVKKEVRLISLNVSRIEGRA